MRGLHKISSMLVAVAVFRLFCDPFCHGELVMQGCQLEIDSDSRLDMVQSFFETPAYEGDGSLVWGHSPQIYTIRNMKFQQNLPEKLWP